jgi:hypothetical protein
MALHVLVEGLKRRSRDDFMSRHYDAKPLILTDRSVGPDETEGHPT